MKSCGSLCPTNSLWVLARISPSKFEMKIVSMEDFESISPKLFSALDLVSTSIESIWIWILSKVACSLILFSSSCKGKNVEANNLV